MPAAVAALFVDIGTMAGLLVIMLSSCVLLAGGMCKADFAPRAVFPFLVVRPMMLIITVGMTRGTVTWYFLVLTQRLFPRSRRALDKVADAPVLLVFPSIVADVCRLHGRYGRAGVVSAVA